MKVEIKSKKELRICLSISVDKKTIQNKLNERLLELQSEVSLKGFRPGKVPATVIKSQFGKAVYGEVIDKLLKETSTAAIKEKKIKAAGQPKLDLKSFGEGKDLNYTLEVDCIPEIKLKPFENFKVNDYKVNIDSKIIEDKLLEIAKQNKKFEDKKETDKAVLGDQITFDYTATVDGNKFEGSDGKGVQLELGKDLFLKGFDNQLVGVKKNETKSVTATLPENHPKKELANKKTKFECKILNIKKSVENKIDNDFAKLMGAKDLVDLRKLIEKQISSQYNQALNSITKKEILDLIDKLHNVDLPKNLVENELLEITRTLKKDEIEKHKVKNETLAKSRIKVGLILNEYGKKNNLKVEDNEVQAEIQKQMKSMPGQEKMVLDYYQKNPGASESLKGAIYEDKIISLLKSKIKLNSKTLTTKEAEKIISDFNKPATISDQSKVKKSAKTKSKKKNSKK